MKKVFEIRYMDFGLSLTSGYYTDRATALCFARALKDNGARQVAVCTLDNAIDREVVAVRWVD